MKKNAHKLLIVESPAKAKTISKYLNGGKGTEGIHYDVMASVGHVRDLPKSNKKAIDIDGGFIPHYEISKGKDLVVADILERARHADEVLLATDPDREGEAIAWHIAELIRSDRKKSKTKSVAKIRRVTYHEITKEAIEEALEHPRDIDEHLREAQEARRVLDRLVGYDLSGLIWKKVRYGLSAGRVQSPALRIIMEREREIRAFVSHPFWVITADVEHTSKPFTLTCDVEPTDKKEVERIVAVAEKGRIEKKWQVTDIKETAVKKTPRAPFITSTLQQTASTRLGFAPSRTMGIAQKLYEAGHITYMRTDSTTLSQQAIGQIASVVEKKFGTEYLHIRTYASKSKNAQEAHEAIRPTHFNVEAAGMNDEQKKLYELIWRRTVSSQMKDAETIRTKISADVAGTSAENAVPNFSITGSRITYDGWLAVDSASRGEDAELPAVTIGEQLDVEKINTEEKQTEPPPRYSEAGLVKELEKRGIGRPSTYATIIKTLEDREYVTKVNKSLIPTDTGDVVSSFLEKNFEGYISDDFTANMEDDLDKIAEGKREYAATLKSFYTPFAKEVKLKDKLDKATILGDADPKFKCPVCGNGMIIKLGRGGKFLSCARYPDCEGALTLEGVEIKKDEPIGVHPETGEPIFVLTGRYGPYVQLGEQPKTPKVEENEDENPKKNSKKNVKKPKKEKRVKLRMASIPKEKDLSTVTVADAVKYLSLPRVLGVHPETGEKITASIGRFGPYIVHEKDFRSLKTDDVYSIELPRALEILKEEKKKRGFAKKKKE